MNFLLIGICILAGFLLRTSGVLPRNSYKGINAWVLYIAMPAMAFLYIPQIHWSSALVLPASAPLLVWSGAWLLLKLCARYLGMDEETYAALLLTAGLGNTSFLGFPLTQAYFGDPGLHIAIICDQIGFITLSTVGVITAIKASHGDSFGMKALVRNTFRFPPFIAFLSALILSRFSDFGFLNPLLTKLAGTLVPLALFSVGLQIRFLEWRRELPLLSLGLIYKMLIAPALVLSAALALRLEGIVAQASVFESAMPPMITAAILASEYRLNPKLSNLMVSIGILLSIASTAFWYLILRALR